MKLSKSCVGPAEKNAACRVLDSEFFGMGREVQNFESELAEYLGRPVVCVVNGTAALQLALQAAGVGVGDEVLVQSLTYVASFQAISATGALPIACDIDPSTCTLSIESLSRNLTSRTKAIMPVHFAGGVGDLDEIYNFAKEHNLRVIEDAAHAFGTIYKGQVIGGSGDIVCFSFDGIKNITSGEGGCIVTSDPQVLDRVKNSRLLGVIGDSEKRYEGKRSWSADVEAQGWRYHMSDLMAAIGRVQLSKRKHLFDARRLLSKKYREVLEPYSDLLTMLAIDLDVVVPHIYPVVLNHGVNRDQLIQKLSDSGIPTGIHYKPNHLYTFYQSSARFSLNATEDIYPRLLTLPLHPDLTMSDVEVTVNALLKGLRDE